MRMFFGILVFFSFVLGISLNKRGQKFLFLCLGDVSSLSLEVSLILDVFARVFLLTVSLISLAVFSFRFRYIASQKFFGRFHVLLITFVFSIFLLILSSNLIFTLVGWDGLGVSSYLLVIYYGSVKSYNAGILTVLTNRFGDVLLLIRIGILLNLGSWRIVLYSEFLEMDTMFSTLLIIGSFTKRAQIPFRAWLPAAIAAPTPVSSLVHSSTLVTAGVYLIFRHFHNAGSRVELFAMILIGLATITLARMSALNEKDIKKIVALSTLRQLGLIILSIGSGWVFISFFHLITHAFFKAIIFISVGNIIHSSQLYQSIKNTGKIFYSSPFNSSTIILARASLCGSPFTAAFFSKEPIIEISIYNNSTLGIIIFAMLRLSMTLLYSSRLIKIVLVNFNSITPMIHTSEVDTNLNKGIFLLSLPSFSRGSVIARLLYLKPTIFLYNLSIKIFIFSSFLIILIILIIRSYPVINTGLVYLFPIWGLSLFSGSVFNIMTQTISFNFSTSGFRTPLILLSTFKRLRSIRFSGLYSRYLVYRLILSIPFFFILISLIYYKLFYK